MRATFDEPSRPCGSGRGIFRFRCRLEFGRPRAGQSTSEEPAKQQAHGENDERGPLVGGQTKPHKGDAEEDGQATENLIDPQAHPLSHRPVVAELVESF